MLEARILDLSEMLDCDETIDEYIRLAVENDDPDAILSALKNVTMARAMMELSKKIGISREDLYDALAEGAKPSYSTINKIMKGLGISCIYKSSSSAVQSSDN